ncbi:MAG: TlpA disulfide reductase family protein [Gemmatimonadota bacterium]|nr:TlpA disulfide reductase family protein [Gemmatimonadota bacterium]
MAALAGAAAQLAVVACAWYGTEDAGQPGGAPRVVASEPVPAAALAPAVDVDSLADAMLARASRLETGELPGLEREIRDWLARLEYGDPALVPPGRPADPFLRFHRGRLLDALGLSALRRGDLRQAEASLLSAVAEIHSRGTTEGYARHFLHLGRLHAERGRWRRAVDAYLSAEVRGMGAAATPALESAYRRLHGSLQGLDALRAAERARVEDERRQQAVADPTDAPLPRFAWPAVEGRAVSSGDLIGSTAVVALWDDGCAGCARYGARLEPLAESLRARGARLVGVWLGGAPGGAPRSYPVLLPPGPSSARRSFDAARLPTILVVDATGRIRYRHGGAMPPPVETILLQVDHLERRRG